MQVSIVDGLTAAVVAVGLVAAGLAVALVRVKRLQLRTIQERGWLLERERESAATGAVRAERERIAGELHDIVSHNVSVMLIQSGVARDLLDTRPDQAATALLSVETAGRDAMTELRHLLGLLTPAQDGIDDTDLSPQPSLSHLSSLVDKIAFAGMPVEVGIFGEPCPLPSGIDLTAYRIVQEALTNALKYSDRSKAEVSIRYADNYLRIEVLNSGSSVLSGAAPMTRPPVDRGVGVGRGLIGLQERVAIYGGDLDARRRLGGGFRVRAKLPLGRQ